MKSQFSNCYDYYFRTYSLREFGETVSWHWLKAMAIAESGLNPEAVSSTGAVGVMQLMPLTGEMSADRVGIRKYDPHIPHENIEIGINYARQCWAIFVSEVGMERIRFMTGAYNAGPGNIIKAQSVAIDMGLDQARWSSIVQALPKVTKHHARETITYVAKVERLYQKLK